MTLDDLLRGLKERNGSDLYLTAESPPLFRVDGMGLQGNRPRLTVATYSRTTTVGVLTPTPALSVTTVLPDGVRRSTVSVR